MNQASRITKTSKFRRRKKVEIRLLYHLRRPWADVSSSNMDVFKRKVLELTSFSWHGDVSGVNSPELEFVLVAIPLSLIKSVHESYHRVLEFKS